MRIRWSKHTIWHIISKWYWLWFYVGLLDNRPIDEGRDEDWWVESEDSGTDDVVGREEMSRDITVGMVWSWNSWKGNNGCTWKSRLRKVMKRESIFHKIKSLEM